MNLNKTIKSPTNVVYTIVADKSELEKFKSHVIKNIAGEMKIPGFREGHAPTDLAEKSIDQNKLAQEVIEEAINHLYVDMLRQEKINPVTEPKFKVNKFVPYETLEIEVDVEIVDKVTLSEYKRLGVKFVDNKITETEISDVLKTLQLQNSIKNDVERPAKSGDQVWIDFAGFDPKTNEAIKNTDGKEYPLAIGSNTFIPGFEDKLIDKKAGDEFEFEITFPKEYAKPLAGTNVLFKVKVNKIQEVELPELNDDFARNIAKLDSLEALKEDASKYLQLELDNKNNLEFENRLLNKLVETTEVELPEGLVAKHIKLTLEDQKTRTERGQTWEDRLKAQNVTEAEVIEKEIKPKVLWNLKASLALAEIASLEDIAITDEELDTHVANLIMQYGHDQKMKETLTNPKYLDEIANRLLSEKIVKFLVSENK